VKNRRVLRYVLYSSAVSRLPGFPPRILVISALHCDPAMPHDKGGFSRTCHVKSAAPSKSSEPRKHLSVVSDFHHLQTQPTSRITLRFVRQRSLDPSSQIEPSRFLPAMSTEATARQFFSSARFAVVGASTNPAKFGHKSPLALPPHPHHLHAVNYPSEANELTGICDWK
jgi:hypothetical protein